ncbi:MAG TPA: CAP domain-containing protein [Terriglobales bacterium]|nr:CAP domain-containing protein [Terriglobales bacterium]
MLRALTIAVSLYLAAGVALSRAANPADNAPKSSWQQVSPYDSPSNDAQAERQLLEKANAERTRLGLPALKTDEGLIRAARVHAEEMAMKGQLTHQFLGEPSLIDRISANSNLHLERAGENVAVAPTADEAHRALMSSPPHRDNLLNAKFNVAGIGVFRKGTQIYVAQDFGASLASYSIQQAKELVVASVEQILAKSNVPRLQRVDSRSTQTSACAMAQADSLSAASPPPGAYMLRYTSLQPEILPASISKVITQRGLHAYSAGTCYAHTQKYPNGAYWVVLVFY